MCHAVVYDSRVADYGQFERSLPGPLYVNAEAVGLPAEYGNVIVTLARCAPAASSRGAPAVPEAATHTYRWRADRADVVLTPADREAFDKAALCVDHPLTVATSHGDLSVQHGNPLSSLGILPHPHFRMADDTLIKRVATAKSKAGTDSAYMVYRNIVKGGVTDSLDACIGHGATVVHMHPVGCAPEHAGSHARRLNADFQTIVAECLREHGPDNEPRGATLTCHVLQPNGV